MCKMVEFKKGKYVADIKLMHINNITEQAEKAKNINRIVLFGSSIEDGCTKESDIDIAVFGDKTRGKYLDSKEFSRFKSSLFKFDWNQDYDVLYFKEDSDFDGDIMTYINDGVEIYHR